MFTVTSLLLRPDVTMTLHVGWCFSLTRAELLTHLCSCQSCASTFIFVIVLLAPPPDWLLQQDGSQWCSDLCSHSEQTAMCVTAELLRKYFSLSLQVTWNLFWIIMVPRGWFTHSFPHFNPWAGGSTSLHYALLHRATVCEGNVPRHMRKKEDWTQENRDVCFGFLQKLALKMFYEEENPFNRFSLASRMQTGSECRHDLFTEKHPQGTFNT